MRSVPVRIWLWAPFSLMIMGDKGTEGLQGLTLFCNMQIISKVSLAALIFIL